MRTRLALALLGLWIGMSVAMAVVASTNFRTVDEILTPDYRHEFHDRLAPRSAAEERPLLRYLASELNRRFFRWWSALQLGLAAMLVGLVAWPATVARWPRILTASAALLTALMSLYLAPRIGRLGPPLDFVARPFTPEWQPRYEHFMAIHGVFMGLELVKLGLLIGVTALLVRGRPTD